MISELYKKAFNQGRVPRLFFWRDKVGHEVDCIIEHSTHLDAIEIKAGKSIPTDAFDNLLYWNKEMGSKAEHNTLMYSGSDSYLTAQGYVKSFLEL